MSMIAANYPFQVNGCNNTVSVSELLHRVIPVAERAVDSAGVRLSKKGPVDVDINRLASDSSYRTTLYPYKSNPNAPLKANIHLATLAKSVIRRGDAERVRPLLNRLAGVCTDDQCCSAILYYYGCLRSHPQLAMRITVVAILNPAFAKSLGLVIKALGMHSCIEGAVVTELGVLLGRGVGMVDLDEEARQRADPAWLGNNLLKVDPEVLRPHIRAILDEELAGRDIAFPSLEEFWARRWQWCVNGSHNTTYDHKYNVDLASSAPGMNRYYRRMYAEAVEDEPISTWDGVVHAGPSSKLEHGKTRVIFACDTLSYFAYEHLLGPVSAAWLHRKVVLDPGQYGGVGLVERIKKQRKKGNYNIMLDYDDFNSQHTNSSMAVLIEETCRKVGYPKEYSSKLIEGFNNTWIRSKGLEFKTGGTLMSGHRGTTYINSVLNAAYIRAAIGPVAYNSSGSLHVGDDVYMAVSDADTAGDILNKCREFGCRMNPSKQSVGLVCGEFLRMAIGEHGAYGYLPRSVASCVSGSWTTEKALDPQGAVNNIIQSCWTLTNRSGWSGYGELLAPVLADIARVKIRMRRHC